MQDVTGMVATYIANEGDYYQGKRIAEYAGELASEGNISGLEIFVTHILRSHKSAFTQEVRDELSENDYDRIDWTELASQLKATFS